MSSEYRLQHAIEIIEHIVVPEPKNAIAMAHELGAAAVVRFLSHRVLASVEFDGKLAPRAGEIDDTPSDRVLPAKLPTNEAFAQRVPEEALDIRGIAAQPPCYARLSP